MSKKLLKFAYETFKDDDWNLPDVDYLMRLDSSEASRKLLEDAAKKAAEKLLTKVATMASQKLLDKLVSRLGSFRLPDHTGQTPLLIADVDYNTSNTRVSGAGNPYSKVTIDGPNVSWNLTNVGIESNGDWKYKYLGLVSDAGTFNFNMAGTSAVVSATIERDSAGNFDLKLGNCECVFGEPDLEFTGSPGCMVLQCIFDICVKPKLREAIPDLYTAAIKDLIIDLIPVLDEYREYWPMAMGVIDVSSNLMKSIMG